MQSVTLASASTRPALDFILPGLLAGTVGLIVGQGAVGKSMLALHIGLGVATGQPIAGGLWQPASTGPVTLIFGEDAPEILQERLYWLRAAAGISEDEAEEIDTRLDVRSADGVDMRIMQRTAGRFAPGPFYETLRELCGGQRLVIIDPLAFLSDADENDNGAMTQLVRTLQGIAADTGATILVLHHVGKGGEGDREEWTAARGASALTTACRWQVYLRPPTKAEQERYGIDDGMRQHWIRCAVVKSNYGPPQPEQWLFRGQGGVLERREMWPVKPAKVSKKGGDDDF